MDNIQDVLNAIFTRYGAPAEDKEISVRDYIVRPDTINTTDRVQYYDKSAADTIKRLHDTIDQLTIYRIALQQRYNYLATAPTVPVVKLIRTRDCWKDNKVFYYLKTYTKNILDNTEVETSVKKYPGTDRRIAINDFNDYVKTHPGIIAEKHIDTRR